MNRSSSSWGGTQEQDASIEALERKGYKVVSKFRDSEGGVVYVMERRRGPMVLQGEIDSDGLVNGKSVVEFMRSQGASGITADGRSSMVAAKAREKAFVGLTDGWNSLDDAQNFIQLLLREEGRELADYDELVKAVQMLESMKYNISGMKRTVAGSGRH